MTPEIVIGPPGCGKTTHMMRLVEEEISRGTDPRRIGFLTFTRRGAGEGISRACSRFGLRPGDLPNFRTLHSLCFRWLGITRSEVLAGSSLLEFADWVGTRVSLERRDDGTAGYEQGDRILHMINVARGRCIPLRQLYDEDDDQLPWSEVSRVSRALAEYKRARHLLDYADFLSEFLRYAPRIGLDVLLVDEAQDLSLLQWRVIEHLAASCRRLVVCGDDDQSIFVWAGADASYLIDMRGADSTLGQSWRVPRAIQDVANNVISRVRHRRPKTWLPRDEAGQVDRCGLLQSGLLSHGESVLVLARNDYVLREMAEPWLREEGHIYQRHGRASVPHDLVSAIDSWERLRRGEPILVQDARHVYKFINARGGGLRRGYKRLPGFGEDELVGLGDLRARGGLLVGDVIWHEALDMIPPEDLSYILAVRRNGERILHNADPRIRVSTIHASKGGEADHVVLMTECAARTWDEYERNPENEARVWYVAATRARKRLTIVGADTHRSYSL